MARPMTGALLLSVLAFGCGIKRYLPGKAVLDADQALAWRAAPPAAVPYRGPPRVGMPVLPLQVFGLYYDLDLVLVSDHPSWDMHEYARVDLPDGPLWLAKDARPTGVQGIVADVPDIERWAPEAAVPRQRGEVAVVDESEGDRVDVTLRYQNLDGELVAVQVQGRVKARPPGKRNGSTMGHSRQSAAVVLDLERFGSAGRVRMSIGGQRVRIKHLLGLYPMKFLLRQAQAGVMVTSLRQEDSGEGFRVHRPGPDPVDAATSGGDAGTPTCPMADGIYDYVSVTGDGCGPQGAAQLEQHGCDVAAAGGPFDSLTFAINADGTQSNCAMSMQCFTVSGAMITYRQDPCTWVYMRR